MTVTVTKASPATRRAVVAGIVLGVPTSVLLLYLATRGLDLAAVWDAVRGADPVRIALSVGVIGVVYCLWAVRWKWVARHLGSARWRTMLRFIIGSVAINNVVPGRPGDLMRGYWLARDLKVPTARAYGTLIVDRSSDVFVLIAMLVGTYAFIPHPAWLRRIVLLALLVGAAIAVWLALTRWHVWRSARGRTAPARLRATWAGAQLSGLVRGTAAVVTRRDSLVIGALSTAVWLLWALAAWLVAGSLDIHLSPVQALFITAAINLGAALPSSPGFIGTFQYISVKGLGLFGVAHSAAFAFSLLMTAIWYIPTTLAGAGIAVWAGGTYGLRRGRTEPAPAPAGARPSDGRLV